MKKLFILLTFAMLALTSVQAQRVTDKLDRGLVAMKVTNGVYLSWRILGEEYYDVTYNVYRNGTKINSEPLTVSNFTDASGSTSSQYTVAPVVKGVEQAKSKAVTPWASSYKEIKLAHEGIASTLVPNDACCADVDGDGELEFLMKFDNLSEMQQSYPKNGPNINGADTKEYSIFEIFKMDGTRLWWVNCGPNMGDFQNNEQNIVGYDWDQDGKAEVLMRLEEGSSIHMADGTVYTIGANGQNGTSWYNFRAATGGGTNWFMHDGKEFLVYCNGATGQIFDIIDYPLARLEPGETNLEGAWGDGYGHRSSKFFFGAPYLDGRNPSIFLARGIYTRHKMAAYDVDKSTHKLSLRWKWYNNTGGAWKGQGYHNYGVADVDMDGRDEILFGSMVIDDNGKGLSTTGLGHGDAQHCGDFNPYIHGLEIYACNEDQPGNNYRDATTSKIYHRFNAGRDDGRSMMDNFSNAYPGALGCSAREGAISSVYNNAIPGVDATGVNTNFRIYWDGDLLSETFNYLNGKNTEGCVAKYGSWNPIYVAAGSLTNNDTKGTPSYQGDILGDWREEMVMRTADNNIRIYSTPTPTSYRMATLWADHQYRNAMVWQMCGYNQPPHVSYFTGELEGITIAPPPLTMTGREEVKNGGTIDASLNGKHAIVCETGNSSVTIADGAQPDILTINVPSWVQGTAGSEYSAKDATIKYDYYTCDVTGGALAGATRLVKQGDGTLNLPKVDMLHTGATEIWEGIVNFDGTMKNSDLWLNRFVTLNSNGGQFKSIKAQYDATINPGGENNIGSITVDGELYMDYGSRIVIDMDADQHDVIKAKSMTLVKKTGDKWTKYGPKYIQPVIEINGKNLKEGEYVIMEAASLQGSIIDFKIEGIETFKTGIRYENGKVILTLGGTRGPSNVTWTGATSVTWDKATTENFIIDGDETKTPDVFVNDDAVTFDDSATRTSVTLNEEVTVTSLAFENNSKSYTISGTGDVKSGSLVKDGTGTVTINTLNSYTGENKLNAGTTIVSKLANSIDVKGNLGNKGKITMSNGAVLQTSGTVTNGASINVLTDDGGVISNAGTFTQEKVIYGTLLTKQGAGTLNLNANNSTLTKLIVKAGAVTTGQATPAKTVELQAGTLNLQNGASCAINVPSGKTARVNFNGNTAANGYYTSSLSGAGNVTVWMTTANGKADYAMRTNIAGNWSSFTGKVTTDGVDGRFVFNNSYGLPNATLVLNANKSVHTQGKTFPIGEVTGTGKLSGYIALSQGGSGTATWNVGGKNTDFTFAGIVTGGAKFNKVGTGTMTVSGIWDTTNAVAVKEGTLKVNSACLGTGALTIDAGATLMGVSNNSEEDETMKNSSVTVNGTLWPTNSPTTALARNRLIFNGKNVQVNRTGALKFNICKAVDASSKTTFSGTNVQDIGMLTILGKIVLKLFYSSTYVWQPAVGDVIRLWNPDNVNFNGTPTIEVETDADQYKDMIFSFDTSRLNEGILIISDITTSVSVSKGYSTQDNTKVAKFFKNGRLVIKKSDMQYNAAGAKMK